MQLGATLLVLGVLAALVYGAATGWQGSFLPPLLILPAAGFGLLLNGRWTLKRARARRERRPRDR
ncbi:hypothetical protein [Actinomycetospora soli]|uniref:hypothetical protein n=1 Tax=Actinomycetospora soli TaxID=2893887 RepID=UPI001E4DAE4B|nr:hypothetical protein [Actinomycetospora soli]MCD2191301.1 hypothetical protein [Actinomycetospora soli]